MKTVTRHATPHEDEVFGYYESRAGILAQSLRLDATGPSCRVPVHRAVPGRASG